MGLKGGVLCPFRGALGTRLIQCASAEVNFRTQWRNANEPKCVSVICPPFLNRFTSGFHQNYLLFKGYKVSYNRKCPHFRSTFSTSTLKFGEGALPLLGQWAGSSSNINSPGLMAYHHAKCQLHQSSRLVTINMGQKFGWSAHFWGGATGSPSNTKSTGPRPTSIPSDILIHAAIWPQQIWAENWGGAVPR